jgi:hypothetical protein
VREMRERDGRIKDAAKVFDEMPMRTVAKNARVLPLDEASRVQDAVGRMLRRCAEQRCAGVARAKGARSSGVRGNDSARPEQARVRQQEKKSSYAGQRRAERRRAGSGVQRMTVFPLGELRPRPSWVQEGRA